MSEFTCGLCGKRYSTKRDNPVLCVKCIAKLPKEAVPASDAEIQQAIENPHYHFEERVEKWCKKRNMPRKDAENLVRTVIATKEIPSDRPHLYFSSSGEAYFNCAEIGFRVDLRDLNKVIGTNGESSPLDKLMDSQIAAIAHSMGWKTDPFVPELIMLPLRGLLQLVWYRDLRHNVDFSHLEIAQKKRVDKYHRDLLEYKPAEPGSEPRKVNGRSRAPKTSAKSQYMSKQFVVLQGAKNVASGRESDLLSAAKTFKKSFSFAELSAAAKNFLKTKQDWDMIVLRFLKELIAHEAVKEVA